MREEEEGITLGRWGGGGGRCWRGLDKFRRARGGEEKRETFFETSPVLQKTEFIPGGDRRLSRLQRPRLHRGEDQRKKRGEAYPYFRLFEKQKSQTPTLAQGWGGGKIFYAHYLHEQGGERNFYQSGGNRDLGTFIFCEGRERIKLFLRRNPSVLGPSSGKREGKTSHSSTTSRKEERVKGCCLFLVLHEKTRRRKNKKSHSREGEEA